MNRGLTNGEQRREGSTAIRGNPKTGLDEGYDALLEELIKKRPDLEKNAITNLVDEKRSKVGGGFLTNQGALFLVGSDLGIALKPHPRIIQLSEIKEELSEHTVFARILSIGAPKIFTKRDDTRFGFVAKVVIFDGTATVGVNIWNKDIFKRLTQTNLCPNDRARITRVRARKTPDGSTMSFSTSDQSEITKVADDDGEQSIALLPEIKSRIFDAGEIEGLTSNSIGAVKGRMLETCRSSDYTRRDGTRGRYISFSLGATADETTTERRALRVVVWENSNRVFEKIGTGEIVTLLSVKAKITSFQGNENLELHGDDTTTVLEHWNDCKLWLEGEFSSVEGELSKLQNSKTTDQTVQLNSNAFIARVLSFGDEEDEFKNESNALHFLLSDSGKRKISLTALGDSLKEARSLRVDDVIVCKPDTLDQIGLKATSSRKGSLSKVNPQREDIPRARFLITQIERIEQGAIVSLDCMTISVSPSREIPTKEGIVRRREATIADPTGEIKLYAWRGLSRKLEKLAPGLRLWLLGVEAQSHEGKKFLVFKNYSRIEPFPN